MGFSGAFRRKSPTIHAQEFDGWNCTEVVNWLFRMSYPGSITLAEPTNKDGMNERGIIMRHYSPARGDVTYSLIPEDVLVKTEDGVFSVMSRDEFVGKYEDAAPS